MRLTIQKKLAAQLMKCSPYRVWINPEELDDVSQAITKADVKGLIKQGVVKKHAPKFQSRFHARARAVQRRKGRQKGSGTRKGKAGARLTQKEGWMNKIRPQRRYLRTLRDQKQIELPTYRDLIKKAKGGFFRSRRHISLYLTERDLVTKK